MKKPLYGLLLFVLLGAFLSLNCVADDEALDQLVNQYWTAESLDDKLSLLHEISAGYSAEMDDRRFWNIQDYKIGDELSEGLIPNDWDEYPYTVEDSFPQEAKGRPCIALWGNKSLAAQILLGFPAEMIASSIAEAEYAVILTSKQVESGYVYYPDATSYHHDYSAYVLNLQTGKAIRFWYHREEAKKSGFRNELDGKTLSSSEIWNSIKTGIVDEMRVEQADGSVLIFRLDGHECYLKGYEGEPREIVVPEEVAGYPVTEIEYGCFQECRTLISVILPDRVRRIGGYAFNQCRNLESFRFPAGLEEIGEYAFLLTALTEASFPEGLSIIGQRAFFNCNKIVSVTLPGTLQSIGELAFYGWDKLSKVILNEGINLSLQEIIPEGSNNIACIYLPGSMMLSSMEYDLYPYMVVYAPEGSQALEWAAKNGNRTVICDNPDELPDISFMTEGDFDFRIINGEAAIAGYHGEKPDVTVPSMAAECSVTAVLTGSFELNNDSLYTLVLPETIQRIQTDAISIFGFNYGRKKVNLAVYIPSAETVLYPNSITLTMSYGAQLTIYAPENSLAQQYVADKSEDNICYFEPWSAE